MSDISNIKITYGGKDYWLEVNDESSRTIAQIGDALRAGGGLVSVEHSRGVTSLGISAGVPITVEYVKAIDVANTYM